MRCTCKKNTPEYDIAYTQLWQSLTAGIDEALKGNILKVKDPALER